MLRRSLGSRIAFATLLLVLTAAPALAPGARAQEGASGVRAEMLVWFKDAEDKLIQLADATPEAKYAWRPAKGVRSTGEVFMHVAAANLGIPNFWSVAPPEGFKFDTYEKSLTKKADIQKALKDSFAHMEKGFESMSDADLDKPAEFFGIKSTVRSGYLLLLSHVHEHLGQSIAYARMNGIVPPWTAKQQAAIEAQTKAKAQTK
jgi:uncharacterized damage-inducible protein DinB